MSRVVGLNGEPVAHITPSERSAVARDALRALLTRLDAGEIEADQWLFIYQKLHPENESIVTTSYMDSDLTMQSSFMLMDNLKFDLMLAARG